jgi:hypothetical protein
MIRKIEVGCFIILGLSYFYWLSTGLYSPHETIINATVIAVFGLIWFIGDYIYGDKRRDK